MSGYSVADRLLHRLALANPAVQRAALQVDRLANPHAGPPYRPVFVCGLARSGTTVVMRLLHDTGAFVSLTYRDMPFVTAPGLWRALSRRFMRRLARRERAHGDGIEVDADSPEAFEEVFWRAVLDDRHLADPHRVRAIEPDAEAIAAFRAFVARVAHGTGRRYLSKNNLNMLRLPALARAFPDACILLVIRDPAGFARSTLAQHRRFLRVHAADEFARRYMGWLGHFEFGRDFRPLGVPGIEAPDDVEALDAPWLTRYWRAVHEMVADALPPGAVLVSQPDLAADPSQGARALAEAAAHKPGSVDPATIRSGAARPEPSGDREADALFETLRARAINAP